MKPGPELFLLQDEAGRILYAPLSGLAARINEAAAGVIGRFLLGEAIVGEEARVIRTLKAHGFFTPAEGLAEADTAFAPTGVTLFPSDGCNLSCRYCYAAAGRVRHRMPLDAGRAAIDLVVNNALAKGVEQFTLAFHGNGEPFTDYPAVREMVRYAEGRAADAGLACHRAMATNGVLGDEQLDFLCASFDFVNISFDGLPDLQNRQRPFPDGSGSFDAVDRTLKRLGRDGIPHGIRATLTEESVLRLEEIAAFVRDRYPDCRVLHVEPAWECGRCLTTGERSADADAFTAHYLAADDILRENDARRRREGGQGGPVLAYSGQRFGQLTNAFCAVSKGGFAVTAQGHATACFEVCEPDDPRSDPFLYGRYDPDAGAFAFDAGRLARLAALRVENIPYCKDCFCRWHCAGDCAAKLMGDLDPARHQGSSRCRITRALTLRQIQHTLAQGEEA